MGVGGGRGEEGEGLDEGEGARRDGLVAVEVGEELLAARRDAGGNQRVRSRVDRRGGSGGGGCCREGSANRSSAQVSGVEPAWSPASVIHYKHVPATLCTPAIPAPLRCP